MRTNKSAIFMVLVFSVATSGCLHTMTGDLEHLVADASSDIEQDLPLAPKFNLDSLAIQDSTETESESNNTNDFIGSSKTTEAEVDADTKADADAPTEFVIQNLPAGILSPAELPTSETNTIAAKAVEAVQTPEQPTEPTLPIISPIDFSPLTPLAQPVIQAVAEIETTSTTANEFISPNNPFRFGETSNQSNALEPMISVANNPLQPTLETTDLPEPATAPATISSLPPEPTPPSSPIANQDPNTTKLIDAMMDSLMELNAASPAEIAPPKPMSWNEGLEKTVEALQSEIQSTAGNQKESLESAMIVLQSLHTNLVDHSQQEAVPSSVKQYWLHQINALKNIVDSSIDDQNVNTVTTATLHELRQAANALRESADLELTSPVFCRKVIGFGQYIPFDDTDFHPNQPVLVYCEIENFSPTIEQGIDHDIYLTQVSATYTITDENGNIVQSHDFPTVTDEARKLRHDFFMHLPIRFGELRIGDYEMQVQVNDFGSGKQASLKSPLPFSIR